jgi:hypothetical protein
MQFVELAPSWECSFTSDFNYTFPCVSDANKIRDDEKYKYVNFCHLDSKFDVFYRRNESNPLSLHNWIEDLNLECSK